MLDEGPRFSNSLEIMWDHMTNSHQWNVGRSNVCDVFGIKKRYPFSTIFSLPADWTLRSKLILKDCVKGGRHEWLCRVDCHTHHTSWVCLCMLSCFINAWLCATLCTVAHQAPLSMGILQARALEWVAVPSSRGSFWPRDWTWVS